MNEQPDLSVVIVNYNGAHHLHTCLDALRAQQGPPFEIIVVDNASGDGSLELLQSFADVRVVALDRNYGFTGGNNRGAAVARGRLLVFLNNDTKVEAGWLQALRGGLDWSPATAVTTSRIVYMHDPSVLDSAGDGVTRAGGAFKRGHGAPASRHLRGQEVFGACGAAFLIVRAVFDEVGGFDEDFFLSHEDVDLSYRVRLKGYACVYVPDAVVQHAGSATMGRTSATSVYYGQRNMEWVYVKNTPTSLLLRSLPVHVIYLVAALAYFTWAGRLPAFLSAKWAALRGLPMMWRKRRAIQASRTATAAAIWDMLEPGWIGLKIREKQFEMRIAGR
ncbi:MAG TPA: glycosyltransferase family 2 protein [Vicinamibacterales bacterium]|nr:glycosyltransferase family 2 protein [Vicinamibacterales bacterium]